MVSRPVVHSFYRYNIEPRLLEAQRRVFAHLGVPLNQDRNDKLTHGAWMTQLMARDDLDDVVVVADIDAFPLSYEAYEDLVSTAERGGVVGLAQTTNHKDPNKIYAAPTFVAFKRSLYEAFGSPDLESYETGDVAQIMTDIAEARGVEVTLIYPRFSIQPQWPLADKGMFGIGTFYGDHAFFHLYQSRFSHTVDLFCAVADGVVAGKHDWARYLEILREAPAPKKANFLTHNFRKLRAKWARVGAGRSAS